MPLQVEATDWDLTPAIDLLKSLSLSNKRSSSEVSLGAQLNEKASTHSNVSASLGDFSSLWEFLGKPNSSVILDPSASELDAGHPSKGVRWRDELDGADLEDNVEPTNLDLVASLRTQKRAARRVRAKLGAEKTELKFAAQKGSVSDTATDAESSEDLERLRRSPDRRAVIQNLLGRKAPGYKDSSSPPTSPSPPKSDITPLIKERPISYPFLWSAEELRSPSNRIQILPRDGLSSASRKVRLITTLKSHFGTESKYLSNSGLLEPAFAPLNVSKIGIHVFIDISNIMIGFHDCLKVARDIPLTTRVQRVPFAFHNFSLVLERGRPAAKRVLVGSDKFPVVQKAKAVGYETNILERVHKAREVTPRRKKLYSGAGGGTSGLSSGSETNTAGAREKWVEQAVDEILHLKILESLIDADKPSTIVLATGDAAEAEYSGGFMRMVERALEKGWLVELVSFKLNTSSAYRRTEFRARWGPMFKWIPLDGYVEQLVDHDE